MKRILVICLMCFCMAPLAADAFALQGSAQDIESILSGQDTFSRVLALIEPSPVIAHINGDCSVRDAVGGLMAHNVGALLDGTPVEILEDKNRSVYHIRNNDLDVQGWVDAANLTIPPDEPANPIKMDAEDMEFFVNAMQMPGDTGYFIWVDIARQRVNVFTKPGDTWQFVRGIDCSTGKNESPTTRGFFTISERGKWFYSKRLQSGAKYWVRFNGAYLFHSVAMDKEGNIIDDVLGQRHSSGCVRMAVDDAMWFFENIPSGAHVFVY